MYSVNVRIAKHSIPFLQIPFAFSIYVQVAVMHVRYFAAKKKKTVLLSFFVIGFSGSHAVPSLYLITTAVMHSRPTEHKCLFPETWRSLHSGGRVSSGRKQIL